MKVLFFTIGNEEVASSRTRIYQYLPYLRKEGIKCRLISYIASWQSKRLMHLQKLNVFFRLCGKIHSFFKIVIFVVLASQYDILFIQRVLLPLRIQNLILLLNKNIIFDFDDAIYLADRWNKTFLGRNKFLKRFQYILKKSSCVIVSNEVLEKVASKFNSNLIRLSTPVDTDRLVPKFSRRCNGRVVVGWIGSPDATKYIEPLKKPLELLAERFPFLKIQLVGGLPLNDWKINILVKQWSLEDEARDLQGLDIGIMPLIDDEWSKGKGGYKLFQYMAVGIPCVASPVGINKEIILDGINGFLASTPEEWLDKLSLLIKDASLRQRMGQEGRRLTEKVYSYKVNAPKLIEALRNISSNTFEVKK